MNYLRGIFLGVVATIFLLPSLDKLFGLDPIAAPLENRLTANAPKLEFFSKIRWDRRLGQYFKDWDSYFRDHFGFRSLFMLLDTNLKVVLFGNADSHMVLVGKSEQYFLGGRSNVRIFKNADLLGAEELSHIVESLIKKAQWAKAHSIKYVWFLVPEAAFVMQDRWPPWMKQVSSVSKADQICKELDLRLKDSKGLEKNFLRFHALEVLRESYKQGQKVFFKKDSHWTWLGAFVAYSGLEAELNRWMNWPTPLIYEDLSEHPYQQEGDLVKLLGVGLDTKEQALLLDPKKCAGIDPVNSGEKSIDPFVFVKGCNKSGPRVLISLRDSFSNFLIPYLRAQTSEIYMANTAYAAPVSEEFIQKIKPDMIFEQTVYRNVKHLPLTSITQ